MRAFNLAAWLAAVIPGTMTLVRLLSGKWQVAAVDALVALAYASTPLLHRFSPLAAPLVFGGVSFAVIFWVTSLVGTGGGERFGYLTIAALSILILGTERYVLSIALAVASVAMIIISEVVLPRDTGFESRTLMFMTSFSGSVIFTAGVLYTIIFYAVRQMERAEETAEYERSRSETLLLNILPHSVAERLKSNAGAEIADAYPEVSVLFADMAGFTARASDTKPEDLVRFLNAVYTNIDNLVQRHGLEKIKTTGDAYMVVSGAPKPLPNHAEALADLAIDIRDVLMGLIDPKGRAVPVRIGIASGPAVAGVVGTHKFFYDVWGDTVNIASRMESTGEAGKIQIAPTTRDLLADRFDLEERGTIEVRGKGPMRTWFLIGRKRSESSPSARNIDR
ncbi:adenylate/guanylate cyclase domain-containing protein [Bradyrhizobium sp. BR 10261]|nr:adenylate/guanylate cyclase domain-containing protein [Bradyrhizobium sp. BR 10261]MBW7963675.1 adenylate/guanylate cyclase domain-containing protein [Bradyrhizobium sp. BR 10261]